MRERKRGTVIKGKKVREGEETQHIKGLSQKNLQESLRHQISPLHHYHFGVHRESFGVRFGHIHKSLSKQQEREREKERSREKTKELEGRIKE